MPSARNKKAANDERLTLYTERLFLATVVLSLIAFFQLLVFGWQGYQLRRSVDVLSQAERAQVFVVVGEHNLPDAVKVFTRYPNSPTMHVGPLQSEISVSYTFKNYGKTPALLREISSRLVYFKKLPAYPYYIASDAILKEYMLAPNDTIVLPHCRLEDMTKEDASTVVHAYSYIWFYGRVIYDYNFGKRHEHRFLWRYGGAHGFRPNYEHKHYVKNT